MKRDTYFISANAPPTELTLLSAEQDNGVISVFIHNQPNNFDFQYHRNHTVVVIPDGHES